MLNKRRETVDSRYALEQNIAYALNTGMHQKDMFLPWFYIWKD